MELATAAGVFSLSLGPPALVGDVGLTGEGAAKGAEEGPAVASSAVMRRLRSRSMGVPGPSLGPPACISKTLLLSRVIIWFQGITRLLLSSKGPVYRCMQPACVWKVHTSAKERLRTCAAGDSSAAAGALAWRPFAKPDSADVVC